MLFDSLGWGRPPEMTRCSRPASKLFILFASFLAIASVEAQVVTPIPSSAAATLPCWERPIGCAISCPHGFRRSALGTCLCSCAASLCITHVCGQEEICVLQHGNPKCVAVNGEAIVGKEKPRPECPRLIGGLCALKCEEDSDCSGRLICCHNGCGRECVAPVQPFAIAAAPVPNSFPIIPSARPLPGRIGTPVYNSAEAIPSEPHHEKARQIPVQTIIAKPMPVKGGQANPAADRPPGECPSAAVLATECPKLSLGDGIPTPNCQGDDECPASFLCCPTAACGNVCTAPTKTTGCLHLLASALRLPQKALAHDFLPVCTKDGQFEKIQCDDLYCWCADSSNGAETPGTRRPKSLKSPLLCLSPRSCQLSCTNKCPHGHKMDTSGCPLKSCECRSPCDGIRCSLAWETCQLVEPDCAQPPCLPVPRCLINPCPEGDPLTLRNGVTALCTEATHCGQHFFCHLIGYNGLGFCCPGEKRDAREGNCPARQPQPRPGCHQECIVDLDCAVGKCCFDGCALRCVSNAFLPHPLTPIRPVTVSGSSSIPTTTSGGSGFSPGAVFLRNKEVFTRKMASCAAVEEEATGKRCNSDCASDASCEGSRICSCVHRWVTSALYSLRSVLQCAADGHFDKRQCDDDGCFCVDQFNGLEQAGTRVPHLTIPTCIPDLSPCRLPVCRAECPHGYTISPAGCPSCVCRNPCLEVKCPQGSFCQLSDVKCRDGDDRECPKQPRCIANACPHGDPFTTSAGFVQNCQAAADCPRHFWCHKFGASSGGVCCPGTTPNIRGGSCPATTPLIDELSVELCKKQCLTDEHCSPQHKCCYNGCGMSCIAAAASFSEAAPETPILVKPGSCPAETVEKEKCPTTYDFVGAKTWFIALEFRV
ncbi:unnamed protein product, partial [Mesorhabditis spiculigera]